MTKLKLVFALLIPLLFLQACATAVVTGGVAGTSIAFDRRTTGTVIDDQGIEIKASYALFEDKEIYDQSHINVTSYNNVVLITGETLTEDLKAKVTAKVKSLPKVRRVYNELIIAAPSALTSRSSDTWITSKVLTKLAAAENVNHFDVKVVTEHSVVFLMGIVSHAEAQAIVDIVSKTAGVQRVVKIFEYND